MKTHYYPSKINAFSFLFFCFFLLAGTTVAQPVLGTTSFSTASNVSLVPSGSCAGGRSATSSGFTFFIFSLANCAINNAFNVDSDGHINLISTPLGTGIWQEGRVSSSDGSKFRLNNFVFSVLTAPFIGKTITVTGYRNGALVPGASFVTSPIASIGIINAVTVDVSGNIQFGNIDEFRLVPSGSNAQGTFSIQGITVSAAVSTLPVTFQEIIGYYSQNNVNIEFTTSEESNIREYEIQESADGLHFVTHHTVPAKNTGLNNYETIIAGRTGNIWIRVKSNEIDGTSKHSKVVFVTNASTKNISVYPNPAHATIFVNGAGHTAYMIRDLQGRILLKGKLNGNKISIQDLKPGIYSLSINDRSFKIIKQ
jgi:hypothetical protein